MRFIRSCMSLPSDKHESFIKKHSPELLHHFTLFDALACIEKPEPPTELITLAPPMDRCYRCLCHLSVHNECDVTVYGLDGMRKGHKISTRCQSCRSVYQYSVFGNSSDGWRLYNVQREYVEASNVCFVGRSMFDLQRSLA